MSGILGFAHSCLTHVNINGSALPSPPCDLKTLPTLAHFAFECTVPSRAHPTRVALQHEICVFKPQSERQKSRGNASPPAVLAKNLSPTTNKEARQALPNHGSLVSMTLFTIGNLPITAFPPLMDNDAGFPTR